MTGKTGQREPSPCPKVFKAKNALLFGVEYRYCGVFFWCKKKKISTTCVTQTFLSTDFRQVGGWVWRRRKQEDKGMGRRRALGNLLAERSRDFAAEEPYYVDLFSNCSATPPTCLAKGRTRSFQNLLRNNASPRRA